MSLENEKAALVAELEEAFDLSLPGSQTLQRLQTESIRPFSVEFTMLQDQESFAEFDHVNLLSHTILHGINPSVTKANNVDNVAINEDSSDFEIANNLVRLTDQLMKKRIQNYQDMMETSFCVFYQQVDSFEEVQWYTSEAEQEDEGLSYRERLLGVRVATSPFEALSEYLKQIPSSYLNYYLNTIPLIVSFQKGKKRLTRKDRRRERRDRDAKEFDRMSWTSGAAPGTASSGPTSIGSRFRYALKSREGKGAESKTAALGKLENALTAEMRTQCERLAIVVGKAISENSLSSYLAAIALLLFTSKDQDCFSLEASQEYLLPVGALLASLFEPSSLEEDNNEERDNKPPKATRNPFHIFLPAGTSKRFRSKSVTNSDISKHEVLSADDSRDEVLSQLGGVAGGGTISDAGSTIGSNFADLGTETASIVGDEVMNDDDALAQAMALSVGAIDSHPKSDFFPSSLFARHSITSESSDIPKFPNTTLGAQDESAILEASSLQFNEFVNSYGNTSLQNPFSSIAPFRCLEYWSSIYGNAQRRAILMSGNGMVSIRNIVMALMVGLNVSLSRVVAKRENGVNDDSSIEDYLVDVQFASNGEVLSLIEFILELLKNHILPKHCETTVDDLDSENLTAQYQEWYFHTYCLSWMMSSLLKIAEYTAGQASKAFHGEGIPRSNIASFFGTGGGGGGGGHTPLKSLLSKLRIHFSEVADMNCCILKPGSQRFRCLVDVPDPQVSSCGNSIQVKFVDGQGVSMFKKTSNGSDSGIEIDYKHNIPYFYQTIRLRAINAFLSTVAALINDSTSRMESILDALSHVVRIGGRLTGNSFSPFNLLRAYHEKLSSSKQSDMFTWQESKSEIEETKPFEVYFVQRFCVEVLNCDEALYYYYSQLIKTNNGKITWGLRRKNIVEANNFENYSSVLMKVANTILQHLQSLESNADVYQVAYGELLLIRSIQLFLYERFLIESEEKLNAIGELSLEFNENRCHSSVCISEDGRSCGHLGPKVWSSVAANKGFEPNSGIYEWTVRIDRCTKGHVFLGVVSQEAQFDKDSYVGIDRNGWGLIGTKSLWHNKGKVVNDFGTGFGSASIVTVSYDSHQSTLSFRTETCDWGVAFESLPKQRLFPAFSLHEKGDQVSILSCTHRKQRIMPVKSLLDEEAPIDNSWSKLCLQHIQTLLVYADNCLKTVTDKSKVDGFLDTIETSPLMGTLFPSMLTFLLSSQFVNVARRNTLAALIPLLTVVAKRLSAVNEICGNKSDDSSEDSSMRTLSGYWRFVASQPTNGNDKEKASVPVWWKIDSTCNDEESNEDLMDTSHHTNDSKIQNSEFVVISGKAACVNGGSTLKLGRIAGVEVSDAVNSCLKVAEFGVNENDSNSNPVRVYALKISLSGTYMSGLVIEQKSQKTMQVEAYKTFPFSSRLSDNALLQLGSLAYQVVSLLSASLANDSFSQIGSSRPEEVQTSTESTKTQEENTAMDVEKESALSSSETSNDGEDVNVLVKWVNSSLFAGGLMMTISNMQMLTRHLFQNLLRVNLDNDDRMQFDTSNEVITPEFVQQVALTYAAIWRDVVLPNQLRGFTQSEDNLKNGGMEEKEAIEFGDSLSQNSFFANFLAGKQSTAAALLDEYLSLHVGQQTAILKIGGSFVARARKMIIVALIKHSGCFPVCVSVVQALNEGHIQLTDKPCSMLIEIWRAASRVVESIIRLKQETGDSYDAICRVVCQKVEFLDNIQPSPMCRWAEHGFAVANKMDLLMDKWYSEGHHENGGSHFYEAAMKLIAEISEFVVSSFRQLSKLQQCLVQQTCFATLRIMGYRSLLFLLGKSQQHLSLPPFLQNGSSQFYNAGISFIPKFSKQAHVNVFLGQEMPRHYSSALSGAATDIKEELKRAFETVYEEIAQHFARSVWTKDRRQQQKALNAWNMIIEPEDHLFLNRVNLFRLLHTILDDIRTSSSDSSNVIPVVQNPNLSEGMKKFCEATISQLTQGKLRLLSHRVLSVVHFLATQIAVAKDQSVEKGMQMVSMRKIASGPDTLSKSLFDLMFAELFCSIRPLIYETFNEVDESKREMQSDKDGSENESYICRMLRLLRLVAESNVCVKILTTSKWLSVFLATIGVGSASIQRRVFRLLYKLLTSIPPENLVVCVPSLFQFREVARFDITADEEDYLILSQEFDGNHLDLHPESGGDGIICILLECVSMFLPNKDTPYPSSSFRQLSILIASESLILLRALLGTPSWRDICLRRFNNIMTSVEMAMGSDDQLSKTSSLQIGCVNIVLGGHFSRRRVGGFVALKPYSMTQQTPESAAVNRSPAQLCSSGIIASLSSGAAEVIVMERQVNASATTSESNYENAYKTWKIDYSVRFLGSLPIRPLRLNNTDILPSDDAVVVPCCISHKFVINCCELLQSRCINWANTVVNENNEDEDFLDSFCNLSTFKVLSTLLQDSNHCNYFLLRHIDLLKSIATIAACDAEGNGLHTIEAVEDKFAEILSTIGVPAPQEASTAQPITSSDNLLEQESGSTRRKAVASAGEVRHSPLRELVAALSPYAGSRAVDPAMQQAALNQMLEIGMPQEWCEFALRRCHYNVEMAINMCLEHGADMPQLIAQEAAASSREGSSSGRSHRDDALREILGSLGARRIIMRESMAREDRGAKEEREARAGDSSQGMIRQLLEMGFPPSWCARAIESNQSNLDAALGWILNHDEELNDTDDKEETQSERASESKTEAAPTTDDIFNPLEVVSGNCQVKPDLTCATTTGGFPSVGCRKYPVFSGKWYYELTVVTAGCVQVGWCALSYLGAASEGSGVGDTWDSWAFDGWRTYLWHETSAEWGTKWAPGDVVGCAIDMDNQCMYYYLNGYGKEVGMGLAFQQFAEKLNNPGVYPCASFNRSEVVKFNFGSTPFKYGPPEGFRPYVDSTVSQLVDLRKNFLLGAVNNDAVQPDENDIPSTEDAFEEFIATEKTARKLFKNEETKALTADAVNYFNVSPAGSNSTEQNYNSYSKTLVILYSRLILLRCVKNLKDLTADKIAMISQSLLSADVGKDNFSSSLLRLLRVIAYPTSRTKVYLQSVSNSSGIIGDVQSNFGSVFSAGGAPALTVLRDSLVTILKLTIKDNNVKLANALLDCLTSDLNNAAKREYAGKWEVSGSGAPFLKDNSQSESSILNVPSLSYASYVSNVVFAAVSDVVKNLPVNKIIQDTVTNLIERVVNAWGSALKSPNTSVKLYAVRQLSYLMQEVIMMYKKSRLSPQVDGKGVEHIVRSIERVSLLQIDSERSNYPLCNEFLIAVLELAASLRYFYEMIGVTNFGAIELESSSHLMEQKEDEADEFFDWEALSGRTLLDGEGWQTWTGRVEMRQLSLPNIPFAPRPRNTERQDFPPELMPGSKVCKKVVTSESTALIKQPDESSPKSEGSDFARWIRDSSASSPSDSIAKLRMIFERSSAAASEGKEAPSSPGEEEATVLEKIGTVVGIETWPGSSAPGSARRVKWDDAASENDTELVRWGADNLFDVTHCQVKNGRVTTRYPTPLTHLQRIMMLGFGSKQSYGIILRMKKVVHSQSNVCKAIVEWPDFCAIILGTGVRQSDGTLLFKEEKLLSGAAHAGWEARFGTPSWRAGSTYLLRYMGTTEFDDAMNAELVGTITSKAQVNGCEMDVTGDVSLQQYRLFNFEERFRANNVAISQDKLSISKVAGGGQGCALGTIGFSSGVHYWEFKIEQAEIGSIFVGVCERPNDTRNLRLSRWQGCGIVNNRTSYRTSLMTLNERVGVYGDHFHSGDIVGVTLDLNAGKLTFYLDGMKYGEHILADLGVAFDNLTTAHAVRPKTYFPIVGLSKAMDRVTLTPRWFSVLGNDSLEQYALYNRAYQLLYSWNLERTTNVPLKQHLWIYREAWRHYVRWLTNSHYRTKTRCSLGSIEVLLDKSDRSCVIASIRLGLAHPLLYGDRIVFAKSSGRGLDVKEEAVIVGCFQGNLWYKHDSQAGISGEIIETGTNAWYLVPSDLEGVSIVKRSKRTNAIPGAAEFVLPRIPVFHGGFVNVFYESGAVMRDGIEIDTSEVICTIPCNTTVYAIERRTNASNINRYLVYHNGSFGWISERMRGGSEETMVRKSTNHSAAEIEEMKTQIASVCRNPYVRNRIYQVEVSSLNQAIEAWDNFMKSTGIKKTNTNTSIGFEDFVRLSSTKDGVRPWLIEEDMQLAELISKIASNKNVHALNLSTTDFQNGIVSLLKHQNSIFHGIDIERLNARAAILRVANLIFAYNLPFFNLETPEERETRDAMGGDTYIDMIATALPPDPTLNSKSANGTNNSLSPVASYVNMFSNDTHMNPSRVWTPASVARRLLSLRRLLFTQTKVTYWEAVLEATTTPTPLDQDEYEDPKEIKTIRINRVRATVDKLASIKSPSERLKQSVFGQLHKEIRQWSNAAFRRSYIGKGHGGQRRAFKVKFIGEGVNDYGGPYRAVFEQVVDELRYDAVTGGAKPADKCLLPLLLPSPNRFSGVGSNQDKFVLSTASSMFSGTQELMMFVGKLLGLAVRHRLTLPLDLSDMVWRPLARQSVSLAHLETVDNFVGRHLKEVVEKGTALEQLAEEGQIAQDFQPEEWLDLTFLCYLPDGSRVPLLPSGEDIAVNLSNWRLYVTLTERCRLLDSLTMFRQLREGAAAVIPVELFPLFTATELEHLICGSSQVDVDLIRRCAEYEEGIDPTSQLVQDFWEVLQEMTDEEKSQFLRFVWARSRLPSSAKDFPMNFKLQKITGLTPEQTDRYLPHAQTCFFSLALPSYSNKEILREKLLYAIKNSPNMDADVRLHTAEGWGDS